MELKAKTKVESVYEMLEERILNGNWQAGELIPTEAELLEEFECSRSTIGTAIAKLAHEGLVERKKRAGTRVLRNTTQRQAPQMELNAYAFVYPSDRHESIWRTLGGFQDAARDANRRTILLTTGADRYKDIELLSRLSEFDVKGVVIFPCLSTAEDYAALSDLLVKPQCPMVLTVNFPGFGVPSVVVDGFHAGYTMTQHLISRGAKRIGYLSNGASALHMRDRYLGYLWALQEAGLEKASGHVLQEPFMQANFRNPLSENRQLASEYLAQADKLDGVICGNDFIALGLLEEAIEMGRKVPDDLMIAGIDDIGSSRNAPIALTTYRVPFEERGRVAFRLLEDICQNKRPPCLETRIRGELVVRESA